MAPGLSVSLAQVENRPPGVRLIATRSSPSCTAEQIEYERRTSSPLMPCAASGAGPAWKGSVSSSVGRHVEGRRRWCRASRCAPARPSVDRTCSCCARVQRAEVSFISALEVVERLAAVEAAVQRLAGRRAELAGQRPRGAIRSRAGTVERRRTPRSRRRSRMPLMSMHLLRRRRDAVAAQLAPCRPRSSSRWSRPATAASDQRTRATPLAVQRFRDRLRRSPAVAGQPE